MTQRPEAKLLRGADTSTVAPLPADYAQHIQFLARQHGLALHYSAADNRHYEAPLPSLVSLLGELGVDAASPSQAAQAVESEAVRSSALLPPVSVRRMDAPAPITLHLDWPGERAAPRQVQVEVRGDDGTVDRWSVTPKREHSYLQIVTAGDVSVGYHDIQVTASGPDGRRIKARQHVLVAPKMPKPAPEALMGLPGSGLGVDLYAVRSARNWGVGDFSDLRRLVAWSADQGLAFVGTPPLHAVLNRGTDISPYSPLSRQALNTMYIDVEAVPEVAESHEAAALLKSPDFQAALSRVRQSPTVEYEVVGALKARVLRLAHQRLIQGTAARSRQAAYRGFRAQMGQVLIDFATFLALQEYMPAQGRAWAGAWPSEYQNPRSSQVQEFRRQHEAEVDFHMWLQFEADRQLGEVAAYARERMPIGLYLDLAVGTGAGGFDPWDRPELFMKGASTGAPPDAFNAAGQNWDFPPPNPDRLRTRDGVQYIAALLRANFRHAGALRVDHALGLNRLFVIPEAAQASEGTYVSMPQDLLLAIIALESRRQNTVVIGEDLGSVPPGLREALESEGLLGYRVLPFEKRTDQNGRPVYPEAHRWQGSSIACATTHDTETLRAFWEGTDLILRGRLGLLDESAMGAAEEGRRCDRQALIERLRAEGLLDQGEISFPVFSTALHRYLARTPAWMMEVRLSNLGVGETTPVNVPGVGPDEFPCWQSKMGSSLEALTQDPTVEAMIRQVVAERRAAKPPA